MDEGTRNVLIAFSIPILLMFIGILAYLRQDPNKGMPSIPGITPAPRKGFFEDLGTAGAFAVIAVIGIIVLFAIPFLPWLIVGLLGTAMSYPSMGGIILVLVVILIVIYVVVQLMGGIK